MKNIVPQKTPRLQKRISQICMNCFRNIILICLIALSANSFAQNFLHLKGYVDDLENVNISIVGTSYGTTTNDKGYYEMLIHKADKLTAIHYSIIGYQDTIVQLNPSYYSEDTIYLNIKMKELQYWLPEVPILMNKYFFEMNDKSILDIYFHKEVIALLISNLNAKTSIVLINYDGNFLNEQFFKRKFHAFYRDCFDNMILIGDEICLQLQLVPPSMSFDIIEEIEVDDFFTKLKPCVFAKEDFYLFKESNDGVYEFTVDQFHKKKERYFSIIVTDSIKTRSPFFEFFDKEAFIQAQDVFQEIIARYYQTTPEIENVMKMGVWDGSILKLINNDFQLFNLISWYQKIEAKPVLIEAVFYNDTLYFINLSEKSVVQLNKSMEMINRKLISYPSSVNIKNLRNFERDAFTHEVYAIFDIDGYKWIGNVDLQKASISKLSIGCRGRNLKFLRLNNDQIYCVFYDSEQRKALIKRQKFESDENN